MPVESSSCDAPCSPSAFKYSFWRRPVGSLARAGARPSRPQVVVYASVRVVSLCPSWHGGRQGGQPQEFSRV